MVVADSAVNENETLAKLLKGRRGDAPGVSSNASFHEYLWVSLPGSVVDAPPLIEMLPAKVRVFPPGVSVTIAGTARGRRCNSGSPRGTWWPQRSATVAECAVICSSCVRQTMKIGLTALTQRPACVHGVFFVKGKKIAFGTLLIAARRMPCSPLRRLWSCCLETDCRSLKSIACGESPDLHYGCADVADSFHRVRLSGKFVIFLLARGVEQVSQDDRG